MFSPAAQPQTVQISGKLSNELLIQIFEYAAAEGPPSIRLNICGMHEAYRYVDDRTFRTGAGKTGFFPWTCRVSSLLALQAWKVDLEAITLGDNEYSYLMVDGSWNIYNDSMLLE